ncbi:putative tyrosine kinase domain protein [Monocercomonoides exilis]|uniref:putative tyrosine kinase domain protein n=1 Tax=Monocercomonoides exilis TaxID=2049356 RepID=UPI0035595285|nr:putative tyrosine kinase domain protein [Monocercomonoides exilis]|eukprot:MONOS_7647.1-p1 / transcript=MONOS_7647.1 / gene=MONOS_7647 / organism=Monocercomonoides_exilis_PA203 / gene_product=tyrosine kinase domain protein / transcript_product=tyrosine kinase domain protein / location=Mono_scaffold00267:9609-12152(+) / protein_length=847 / sequence_SO=supercontig / SO=protein_coding / is_pseudo=false
MKLLTVILGCTLSIWRCLAADNVYFVQEGGKGDGKTIFGPSPSVEAVASHLLQDGNTDEIEIVIVEGASGFRGSRAHFGSNASVRICGAVSAREGVSNGQENAAITCAVGGWEDGSLYEYHARLEFRNVFFVLSGCGEGQEGADRDCAVIASEARCGERLGLRACCFKGAGGAQGVESVMAHLVKVTSGSLVLDDVRCGAGSNSPLVFGVSPFAVNGGDSVVLRDVSLSRIVVKGSDSAVVSVVGPDAKALEVTIERCVFDRCVSEASRTAGAVSVTSRHEHSRFVVGEEGKTRFEGCCAPAGKAESLWVELGGEAAETNWGLCDGCVMFSAEDGAGEGEKGAKPLFWVVVGALEFCGFGGSGTSGTDALCSRAFAIIDTEGSGKGDERRESRQNGEQEAIGANNIKSTESTESAKNMNGIGGSGVEAKQSGAGMGGLGGLGAGGNSITSLPSFVVMLIVLIIVILFRLRLVTVAQHTIVAVEEEEETATEDDALAELAQGQKMAERGRGVVRREVGPGGKGPGVQGKAAAEAELNRMKKKGKGPGGEGGGGAGGVGGDKNFGNVRLSERGKAIEKAMQKFVIPESQLLNSKHLASGGFADVFTCDWNDTRVAVKRMKPTLPDRELENFLIEMELMSKLHHPNLVRLVGCGFRPYFIVMQYVSRGSLHDLLVDHRTPLTWKITRQFSLDIAKALWYMHTMKTPMTHRDIKSGNILVDRDWSLKMTDFGLSRPEDPPDLVVVNVLGTPQWTAPEVLKRKPYSLKADVYSYAIVMWELINRRVPYQGKNLLEIVNHVANKKGRPDMPAKLPPHVIVPFKELMERAWDHEPKNRPSMRDIVNELLAMPPE